MEKNVETTIMGYIGTTMRIDSFMDSYSSPYFHFFMPSSLAN